MIFFSFKCHHHPSRFKNQNIFKVWKFYFSCIKFQKSHVLCVWEVHIYFIFVIRQFILKLCRGFPWMVYQHILPQVNYRESQKHETWQHFFLYFKTKLEKWKWCLFTVLFIPLTRFYGNWSKRRWSKKKLI